MAHNHPLVVYKSKTSGAYQALLVEVRRWGKIDACVSDPVRYIRVIR